MATRYRWYIVNFRNLNFVQIVDLLAGNVFTDRSDFGFALTEREKDVASFRFFARTTVSVSRADLDGNTTYEQIETLEISNFALRLSKGVILLRSKNPGRTLRVLFNAIGQIAGLGFTTSPIVFTKHAPKRFLSKLAAHKLIDLRVRGILRDLSVSASMEFQSKSGLELSNLPVPKGFEYEVLQATYEVKHDMAIGQIGYFSNGTIRISGELDNKLLGLVERELVALDLYGEIFRP
jgi:hypothetical protein